MLNKNLYRKKFKKFKNYIFENNSWFDYFNDWYINAKKIYPVSYKNVPSYFLKYDDETEASFIERMPSDEEYKNFMIGYVLVEAINKIKNCNNSQTAAYYLRDIIEFNLTDYLWLSGFDKAISQNPKVFNSYDAEDICKGVWIGYKTNR